MELDWFLLFLQILLIDLVLGGDNAVVIGMASRKLPLEQRKKAIWWGAFGAIGLRVVLTIGAVYVLQVPYIQAIGSFLLIWIAVKLLSEEDGASNIKEAATLGKAIQTIILADFVMSLDNVLAIAAKADNDISVIIVGIGLSIPIIIYGSTIVSQLLNKYPILIYLGAGILGYTAGEMLVKDKMVGAWFNDLMHILLPIITTIIVIAIGFIRNRSHRHHTKSA